MNIERNFPVTERILDGYKDVIGVDLDAYRNHIYRMMNLCYAARELTPEEKEKIQIAGAFHDIGIWTDNSIDYLPPSRREAEAYLIREGKEAWLVEVSDMIEFHHGVKACDSSSPLVEIFRRADVADFSLGIFRMGFPRSLITELKAAFPNNGFHARLLQLGSRWFIKHPLNPLPMFRF